MKILLVLLITFEALLAWIVSRKLRISKNRVSTLELFIVAHIPLMALGVATCSYHYSWSNLEATWILAFYVPLSLIGALIGAAFLRLIIPSRPGENRIEVDPNDPGLTRTCLACFLVMMLGLWAMSTDTRSFTELVQTERTQRWVSSMDQLPFKQLNQVLIIPVSVLFACLFVHSEKLRKTRVMLFLFSSAGFAFSCMMALSRGRIFQIIFAACLTAWYLGSRKVKRSVVVFVLVTIVLFGPLSVALWKYRETLDFAEAIQTVTSMEWLDRMGDDPTFECTDICMAVLNEFKNPEDRRYIDGVTPVMFFFIPRRIWTEKPVVFGPLVWRDVLEGPGEVIGVGPTFIGETYATAGEVGIFLGSVILGMLLVLYEFICLKFLRSWEAVGMITVVLIPAATIVRGDFHSAFIMRFVVYPMVYFTALFLARMMLNAYQHIKGVKRSASVEFHQHQE